MEQKKYFAFKWCFFITVSSLYVCFFISSEKGESNKKAEKLENRYGNKPYTPSVPLSLHHMTQKVFIYLNFRVQTQRDKASNIY